MVKGVNKTIIEVNNTGSKYFEKIVFYVTPEYGNLSAKQLQKATGSYSFNFDDSIKRKPLRQIKKQRKILKSGLFVSAGVTVLTIAAIIIF